MLFLCWAYYLYRLYIFLKASHFVPGLENLCPIEVHAETCERCSASPFSDITECSGKTYCQCRSQRLLIAVLNPAIIYLQIISSDYDKCGIKALFIRGIIGNVRSRACLWMPFEPIAFIYAALFWFAG